MGKWFLFLVPVPRVPMQVLIVRSQVHSRSLMNSATQEED